MNSVSITEPRNLLYKGGRNIEGLQLLKLICAILVVHIHVSPPYFARIDWLCRVAVPVFFMITGYFLPDCDGVVRMPKLKRTLIKILKITVVANLAYISVSIIARYLQGSADIVKFYQPGYWLGLFLFGINGAGHLWYLTALLFSLLALMLCLRFKRSRILFVIVPLGLLLNLALGSYGFVMFDHALPFSWTRRNFVTTGIPFVLLGLLVRHFEHRLPSVRVVRVVTIIMALCSVIECEIVGDYRGWGDLYFFTAPLAVAVFVLFLRMDIHSGWAKAAATAGALFTLDIYVWHVLFSGVMLRAHKMWEFTTMFDVVIVLAMTCVFVSFLRTTGVHRIYTPAQTAR